MIKQLSKKGAMGRGGNGIYLAAAPEIHDRVFAIV